MVARKEVDVTFSDLARIGRINLFHVVRRACSDATHSDGYELIVGVHLYRLFPYVRIQVAVEVISVRNREPGTIAHIQWHALKGRALFPELQADLVAHPISEQRSELVIHGNYRPPLGALGLIGDRLIGHRVAQSSAKAFLDELSLAIEAEVLSTQDLSGERFPHA